MQVMIVESRAELADLWKAHLQRLGASVTVAGRQDQAIDHIMARAFDVIVLDLVLEEGSALAVADFANYRQPSARVLFVTNTSFFSDGSIFKHCTNACGYVPSSTPPEDIAAMVEHHARA